MNTAKIKSKKTKIIAHRGLSGLEKENTCAAFVAAGNRSYYGIETDVHMTNDGKFVVIHDETTDRITNGLYNICVEESSYNSLKNVILPDIDNTLIRRDLRIPLLEEYVSICKKYHKKCVLEVKKLFSKDNIRKLTEVIKGMDYLNETIFISFEYENCVMLRELLADAEIQFLAGDIEITGELIDNLLKNNFHLDIYYKVLTKKIIHKLHSQGIKVNCWTCDNKHKAKKLIKWGVDYITTNILE